MRLLLDGACEELERSGIKATPPFADGFADELIVDAARAETVDMVVVGSHGRTGVRRLWIGRCFTPPTSAPPPTAASRRRWSSPPRTPSSTSSTRSRRRSTTPPTRPFTMAAVLPDLEAAAQAQGKERLARYARPGVKLAFQTLVAPAR